MKEYYLVLEKRKRYQYGAFPRTKKGKILALQYVEQLKKEHKMTFILK